MGDCSGDSLRNGRLGCGPLGAKEELAVARYGCCGLVSQVAVALGVAFMIRSVFPVWGAALNTLAVAMIVINELVGPLLVRWGVSRAGEV